MNPQTTIALGFMTHNISAIGGVVTFGQKISKLNRRPVYCLQLYSSCCRIKKTQITDKNPC